MNKPRDDTRDGLARELFAGRPMTEAAAYDFVDRCIRLGLAKAVEELTSDGDRNAR